jgi:hypothetical protein
LRSAGALASSPARGRGASRRRPIEQSAEGTKGLFVFFLLFRVFSVFCGQLSNFWMALVFSLLLSNIFRSLSKKKKESQAKAHDAFVQGRAFVAP